MGTFPPGGKAMRTGRPVRVRIGAPIPVAGRDQKGLMREVREFFVQNVEGASPSELDQSLDQ